MRIQPNWSNGVENGLLALGLGLFSGQGATTCGSRVGPRGSGSVTSCINVATVACGQLSSLYMLLYSLLHGKTIIK